MNRIFILFSFISIPFCLSAHQKDSLVVQPYVLDEIVVSPFKQGVPLKQLPASVSEISGMAIRNQHLSGTKDISVLVPNLFMPDYGSKYTSPVFVRGIGSKTGSPSVGLYVDGIPYFEKSAFDIDLYEIESVEVLRGPQGTLYGRNTMGGMMDVTTRSPLKYQYTRFSLDGGSHQQYQLSASHYAKLTDHCGYSLSGKLEKWGGYFMNTYKGEPADEGKSAHLRARLEWRIRPQLNFTLTSLFDRSLQGANAYAPYDVEKDSLGAVAFDGVSSYHRTLSATGMSLRYEGSRIQINYQHSLQYTNDKIRQDQDFTTANRVNSLVRQNQLMTSGELNVKGRVGRHYRGLTGAFGFYQHVRKNVTTDFVRYETGKHDVLPTYGVAVYHQSVIDRIGIEGLSLTLGLRYDYERGNRDFTSTKNQASPSFQSSRLQFHQWVPKVALQYMFPVKGQIYANVSKGYKTGGFNTSFNEESEKTYGPESSWNYELGAKHPFWDKRFTAEVALFWIQWKNQQVQQKVETGGFMIRNAGRSSSKGVELAVKCNPVNGLNLNLNYGYTHATFQRYRQSEQVDYAGKYIPLVPRQTLGGSISYARSLNRLFFDRFQLGMNFHGNGKTFWQENNREVQPFYAVLNASASISRKKLTLGLWTKNLTQTKYITYLFRSSAGTFVQQGKPFTIGGTLTFDL